MLSKTSEISCPVDHGKYTAIQPLTDAQIIIQEAAIDVHNNPLLATDASQRCEERLKIRYLNGRDTDSSSYYLATHELMGNVRRVTTQALGLRAVYSAMPSVKEMLESGFGTSAESLEPEYNASHGHVHTGDEARLMRLTAGGISRMTQRTFGSFSLEERWALQDDFEERTRIAATATIQALDYKYGESWRDLPEKARRAPYENDVKDRLLTRLLGKLANRSHSLETSFYNASLSGAESGMIMIKHFREALRAAECPRPLWRALAFSNAAKISLPSSMTFWDAKQLHEVDIKEQLRPIFVAHKRNSRWRVGFADSKYQKIYERQRPVGCQGAFVLPAQNDTHRVKLSEWHDFMKERSQGHYMDTDYREGVSSSQMVTLGAIAIACREYYL